MSRPRPHVALTTVLVVVGALGLVSGCGGHDHSGSVPPVTVDTRFGRVEVPHDPQRVVAVGWGDAEVALALGVEPVGASDWLGFGASADGVGPWAQGLYTTAPELLGTTDLDLRQIAALHPDLILDTRDSGAQSRYQALAKIAPTVSAPTGADNFTTDTDQQVALVAAALGRSDDGQRLLDDLDARLAAAAEAHHDFAASTATAAGYSNNGWAVYTGQDPRALLLARLGFRRSPVVQQLPTTPTYVPTTDQTSRLADVVVSFPVFVAPTAITRQPGYRALAAVRLGHAVVVSDPSLLAAFDVATPASLEYAAARLVPLLAKATPAAP